MKLKQYGIGQLHKGQRVGVLRYIEYLSYGVGTAAMQQEFYKLIAIHKCNAVDRQICNDAIVLSEEINRDQVIYL